MPEDALRDVASGINSNPTFEFSRRIFELHIWHFSFHVQKYLLFYS